MKIIDSIANLLKIPPSVLDSFISGSPYKYKVYTIPKRNGGRRTIAQPSKELKIIQRLLIESLINELPVHSAATAYVKGVGIRQNAKLHKNQEYLLKMDFSNYFPSITERDIKKHLEKYFNKEASDENVKIITNILCYKKNKTSMKNLSIGAPSSPFVSNSIMYDFDLVIYEWCKKEKIVYSRYADDLTFSSNVKGALYGIPDLVKAELAKLDYPRLNINEDKTIFSSKAHNRHVTGLVLTNDNKISIGRKKKRYIRSLAHKYSCGQLEQKKVEYLKGFLSYCNNVEPEFIESLKKKYGEHIYNLM